MKQTPYVIVPREEWSNPRVFLVVASENKYVPYERVLLGMGNVYPYDFKSRDLAIKAAKKIAKLLNIEYKEEEEETELRIY